MIELKNFNQKTDPNCLRIRFQQVHQQNQLPRSTARQLCDVVIYLTHPGQVEPVVGAAVN